MPRRAPHHALAATLTCTVLLTACTPGATPSPEEQAATVSEQLGTGWDAEVVEDARDGTFVLAVPEQAQLWRIGEPTDGIAAMTDDTAWARFWLPALEEADSDRSNVRAMVVDTTSVPGEVVSWQVNVNAADPGLALETDELLPDLRTRFEAQGLQVERAEAVGWGDTEVALIAFTVPEANFGGEARYVRQWFVAVEEPAAMWSFSCDAPADPAVTAALCRDGLDGFRIAEPLSGDRA